MATASPDTGVDLRALIERPLSPAAALAVGAAVLIAGASYCMGYAILSGGTNEWTRAIGWSAGAVLPWLVAFEAIKWIESRQALRWRAILLMLVATGLASLALEAAIDRWIWGGAPSLLPLQLLRRLPAIAVLLVLLFARRALGVRAGSEAADPETPAVPGLRFVRAADNYVELHFASAMQMQRETLNRTERRLARHGFVRVHRSILVHPRHVAAVESGGRTPVLVLDDGARLPTGERYRAALRHFVP